MLKGVVGCMMGSKFGVEVSNDSDANGIGHSVILNNEARAQEGIGVDGLETR